MAFVILTSQIDPRPSWYLYLRCRCDMDTERILLSTVRILCLSGSLYTTVSLSWLSACWITALLVSIFVIKPMPKKSRIKISEVDLNDRYNPLRGKPKNPSEEDIPENVQNHIKEDILKFVLHDPYDADCLHNFEPIKQHSKCIFAKRARIWGSRNWDVQLTLEENVYRNIPSMIKFCHVCQHLGLDSFLFEVPNKYASDVKIFGDTVRRLLTVLSDNDPKGFHCMDKSYIEQPGWVFEFNHVTCFVTTFAPCYTDTHSRYAYGCDNGYIMIQPEISFAQHDLPEDTPHTNWDHPVTVRDRIRVGFKEAGMPYKIRDTIRYPMVHDIVKPDSNDDDKVIWWNPTSS